MIKIQLTPEHIYQNKGIRYRTDWGRNVFERVVYKRLPKHFGDSYLLVTDFVVRDHGNKDIYGNPAERSIARCIKWRKMNMLGICVDHGWWVDQPERVPFRKHRNDVPEWVSLEVEEKVGRVFS